MQIVGSTVERINDPGRRRIGARASVVTLIFLAEEFVLRKTAANGFTNRLLRSQVSVGHKVKTALCGDPETAPPILQNSSGSLGGLLSNIQVFCQRCA